MDLSKRFENGLGLPDTIKKIHESPYRAVLAITGGGTGSVGELLRHGRGSNTVLEVMVPYSKVSLQELLGKEPIRSASVDTAKEMAMAAYRRALYLSSKTGEFSPNMLIGIGVTCKLAKSGKERVGRSHEIHFSSQSYDRTTVSSLFLNGNQNREKQEKIASQFIIEKISSICCPDEKTELRAMKERIFRDLQEDEVKVDPSVAWLLSRTLEDINSKKNIRPLKVDMLINRNISQDRSRPRIILSGSFNPCHKNHIEMARIACGKYKVPVDFEISLANVDKPPIDYISLQERTDSVLKYRDEKCMGNLYLTNSSLFADKAILFPDSVFIIGTDTLNRLFNEKYYREGEDRQSLLDHFKKHNVRFMVFRRKDAEADNMMEIPEICDVVSQKIYDDDGTSSSMIREQQNSRVI
ncbi:MAG: hypothetical protein QCH31_06675 [Methanolobus sp.]|nr:hypothetical protein [Methanolobus sp.]